MKYIAIDPVSILEKSILPRRRRVLSGAAVSYRGVRLVKMDGKYHYLKKPLGRSKGGPKPKIPKPHIEKAFKDPPLKYDDIARKWFGEFYTQRIGTTTPTTPKDQIDELNLNNQLQLPGNNQTLEQQRILGTGDYVNARQAIEQDSKTARNDVPSMLRTLYSLMQSLKREKAI